MHNAERAVEEKGEIESEPDVAGEGTKNREPTLIQSTGDDEDAQTGIPADDSATPKPRKSLLEDIKSKIIGEGISRGSLKAKQRQPGLSQKRQQDGKGKVSEQEHDVAGNSAVSHVSTTTRGSTKSQAKHTRGLRRKSQTPEDACNSSETPDAQQGTNKKKGKKAGKTFGLRRKKDITEAQDLPLNQITNDHYVETQDMALVVAHLEEQDAANRVGAVPVQGRPTNVIGGGASSPYMVEPDIGPIFSNQGLLEATRVDSSRQVVDVEAEPVDLEMQQKQEAMRQKEKCYQRIAFVVVLVMLLGIVLGVVFGIRKQDPEIAVIPRSTDVPTVAPTTTTTNPSTSLLIKDLPPYTLQNLVNPDSAQSRAYYYISTLEDLSNMEDWRKRQLFALATLYYSFGGDRFGGALRNDWLGSRPECGWFSSSYILSVQGAVAIFDDPNSTPVCDDLGRFQVISFKDFPLNEATMPPEVGFLTSLKELKLPRNNITAPLSGMLPPQLAQLSNLTVINLSYNNLYGPIPTELGFIRGLEHLFLQGNKRISGTLMTEFGLMTGLRTLDIASNSLTGSLPSEISDMTSLDWFYLPDNILNGSLRPLTRNPMINLKYLSLHSNELSGSLSRDLISSLPIVQQLDIHDNALSSFLLTELGLLSTLRVLDVSRNSLTSTIPSELALLPDLSTLDLSFNDFRGTIPHELGRAMGLNESSRISLTGNTMLSGTLPLEWCQASSCYNVTGRIDPNSTELQQDFGDLEVDCEVLECDCSCEDYFYARRG